MIACLHCHQPIEFNTATGVFVHVGGLQPGHQAEPEDASDFQWNENTPVAGGTFVDNGAEGVQRVIDTTAAPKVAHEFTMTVYVAAPTAEETRIKAKRLVDGLGNMMKGQGIFPMMMEEVRPAIRVKKECTMEEVAEAVYFLKPGMEFLHPELAERIEFLPES